MIKLDDKYIIDLVSLSTAHPQTYIVICNKKNQVMNCGYLMEIGEYVRMCTGIFSAFDMDLNDRNQLIINGVDLI